MTEGKIIIINSEEKDNNLLRFIFTNRGFDVSVAISGKVALDMFTINRFDLVYLDMCIRDLEPLHIIRELKKKDPDVIIIALVPQNSMHFVQEAFSQGAYDYIKKPLDKEDVYFITKRAMIQRRYFINHKRSLDSLDERNISLQKQNLMLAKRIEESTHNLTQLYEDLQNTYMHTIKALAQAIDARDHYTHSHSQNVTKYAQAIALEMKLDTQKIEEIIDACQLHDLGKIGVHDYILLKPGKLTMEEFEEVKLHALKGAQILEPLRFLEGVTRIVKQHHERYDGKGYPFGLKEEQIDLGARIMSIADTYDAMTSPRPYRMNPFSKQEAVEEIKKERGSQFDPNIIDVFLKVANKF